MLNFFRAAWLACYRCRAWLAFGVGGSLGLVMCCDAIRSKFLEDGSCIDSTKWSDQVCFPWRLVRTALDEETRARATSAATALENGKLLLKQGMLSRH